MKKVILNMFVCDRKSQYWEKCVEILHTIDFPTSIETSSVHHNGLGVQVLLDFDDIEKATDYVNEINLLGLFLPIIPLVFISEVDIEFKNTPIGEYQDYSLVNPGRKFDDLVSKKRTGFVRFIRK